MAIGGVACLLIYVLPAAYIDDHGGRLTLSLIGQSCVIYRVFQSTVVNESGLPVTVVYLIAVEDFIIFTGQSVISIGEGDRCVL